MPKRMAIVKCEERNILSLPRDEVHPWWFHTLTGILMATGFAGLDPNDMIVTWNLSVKLLITLNININPTEYHRISDVPGLWYFTNPQLETNPEGSAYVSNFHAFRSFIDQIGTLTGDYSGLLGVPGEQNWLNFLCRYFINHTHCSDNHVHIQLSFKCSNYSSPSNWGAWRLRLWRVYCPEDNKCLLYPELIFAVWSS